MAVPPELKNVLAKLERHYGRPPLPPARRPFELVIWENAVYLLPDERRIAVFEGLRRQVGLTAKAIQKAPVETLVPLAEMGGMRPGVRVARWQEIASITLREFGGDLDQILRWDYAKAKKALKLFPSIGDPGAEKILMYCGVAPGLPLESNGLRVLTRIGYGRLNDKNYTAMYRTVQEAIAGQIPSGADRIARAHLVLRAHGQTLCKHNHPACVECPVSAMCVWRGQGVAPAL
jgi:endonuclease-3